MTDHPSVGRIVHHVGGTGSAERYGQCQAAIITALGRTELDTVEVCVFHAHGPLMHQDVQHDESLDDEMYGHKPDTWHWPERT